MKALHSMLRRRGLVLGVLVALVAMAALVRSRDPSDARPNVVLVLVDALRRDHVGLYGHDVPTTPFLDELAERGVVFDNAWSHAPQTFNATAAVLTGQVAPLLVERMDAQSQPVEAAIVNALADENQTLAETLAAGGYDTLGIFTNPHHEEGSGFAQGFRLWRYLAPARSEDVYARADGVEAAVRELAAQLDPRRPFFAYVHYMDVHNPYQPPPALAARFVRTRGVDRYVNGRPAPGREPSSDDLRFMMESYDACIRHVDDSLRTLAGFFAARAGGRGTVFVVMADHGDEFMDHGGLGHGHAMYPELLRVPLVLSGGEIPQGRRVPTLVRGIDVTATIASLAQVPRPGTFEGRSLQENMDETGGPAVPSEPVSTNPREVRVELGGSNEGFAFAWNAHQRSLTTENLHLMADLHLDLWQIYDVRADPGEQENLLGSLGKPARRMRRKLEEYEMLLNDVAARSAALGRNRRAPAVDQGTVEQLKALGYAE